MTIWWCELCNSCGNVQVRTGEDVWTVAQRLLEAHGQRAPDCEGGRYDIRTCAIVTDMEAVCADQ